MGKFDGGIINHDASVIVGMPSHGNDDEANEATNIASPDRGRKVTGDQLPHSGGPLQSSGGMELAAENYAKRKGSDECEKTAA